ncbi:MAG: hypothetical protein NZ529_05720 [Cytophagaceae bacterium]|nr:hypothetical protein [Cytophagaceae bacterium]MDW8456275.1 hypothetical protein [Cytophagaceae bacterium]
MKYKGLIFILMALVLAILYEYLTHADIPAEPKIGYYLKVVLSVVLVVVSFILLMIALPILFLLLVLVIFSSSMLYGAKKKSLSAGISMFLFLLVAVISAPATMLVLWITSYLFSYEWQTSRIILWGCIGGLLSGTLIYVLSKIIIAKYKAEANFKWLGKILKFEK